MADYSLRDVFKQFGKKIFGSCVNSCVSESQNLPLAASQGKVLQDQITQLNSNIEIKYYNTGEKEIDIYDSYTDTGQKYNMSVGAHILIGFIRNATNSEILIQAALYQNNSIKSYTGELSILPYMNTSYIIPLVIESPSEIKLMLKSDKTSTKVNFVNFTDIRFKNR